MQCRFARRRDGANSKVPVAYVMVYVPLLEKNKEKGRKE
jgi:hypothetical protein